LDKFKAHVLEQVGLSGNVADSYIFSSKGVTAFTPLSTELELREAITKIVRSGHKVEIKIEKFSKLKGKLLQLKLNDEQGSRPNHKVYPPSSPEEFCAFCGNSN
jgi:hypothetical protein